MLSLAPLAQAIEISADTRWTRSESPYLFAEDVIINRGVELTIEEGVEVSMERQHPDDVGLSPGRSVIVRGSLRVLGTSNSPVRFDGAHGATDDWGGIYFTPEAEPARFAPGGDYLSGSIISNATISDAGNSAIFCEGSAPFIQQVTFSFNAALYDKGEEIVADPSQMEDEVIMGGAIYIYRPQEQVRICSSSFQDNYSLHVGGALAVAESGNVEIEIVDCSFVGNAAGAKGGGAIRLLAAPARISNVDFHDNRAERGGVLHASYQAHVELLDCDLRGNQATTCGGALFVAHENDAWIQWCDFVDNAVVGISEHGGGAIACHANGVPTIAQCRFEGNKARHGGAIALVHRNQEAPRVAVIACSLFADNQALLAGEADQIQTGDWQDLVVRGNEITVRGGGNPMVLISTGDFAGDNTGVVADLRQNYWRDGDSFHAVETRARGHVDPPQVTLGADRQRVPGCVR
jgi:hypothetical protein